MTARMSDGLFHEEATTLARRLLDTLVEKKDVAPNELEILNLANCYLSTREAARRLCRPVEAELREKVIEIIHQWWDAGFMAGASSRDELADAILALVSPAAVRRADEQEEIDVPPLPHKIVDKLRCFSEIGMADHDAAVRRDALEEVAKWCDECGDYNDASYGFLETAAHCRRLAEEK